MSNNQKSLIATPNGTIYEKNLIAAGLTKLGINNCYEIVTAENPDIVAIHDAVRPFVSEDLLKENVARAILHGAADTCIPSADTLVFAPGGERIEAIPKREEYLRGQTPQTFRFDWICEAHKEAIREGISNASDDCRLVLRRGLPIYVVRGSEGNIKITTEFDLMLAEILVQRAALQKPSIF